MSINGVEDLSTETKSNGARQSAMCSVCNDSGVIEYPSEIAGSQDRRWCSRCEAGRRLGTSIATIISSTGSNQPSGISGRQSAIRGQHSAISNEQMRTRSIERDAHEDRKKETLSIAKCLHSKPVDSQGEKQIQERG